MKMVTDVCDGGGTMEADPDLPAVRLPEGYQKYTDPRLVPPITLALENEVNVRRLEAVRQFARLNGVNRQNGAAARVGILSTGKTYYDLMQALRDLKVRDGIRIGKIGMPFPLDAVFVKQFAEGLQFVSTRGYCAGRVAIKRHRHGAHRVTAERDAQPQRLGSARWNQQQPASRRRTRAATLSRRPRPNTLAQSPCFYHSGQGHVGRCRQGHLACPWDLAGRHGTREALPYSRTHFGEPSRGRVQHLQPRAA